MTRAGAISIIESLMFRLSEIEKTRERLIAEEKQLVVRIHELEKVRDPIVPNRIVLIGG
jgi:hypothetical protein